MQTRRFPESSNIPPFPGTTPNDLPLLQHSIDPRPAYRFQLSTLHPTPEPILKKTIQPFIFSIEKSGQYAILLMRT